VPRRARPGDPTDDGARLAPPAVRPLPDRQVARTGRDGLGLPGPRHPAREGRRLKVPQFTDGKEPQILARFYQEARAAATVHHPHVCPVYDVGEIDGVHYLTMAFIEGKPLEQWVGSGKPLSARQVATLGRKVADALEEAHKKGVIHRDLKPANVMIDRRGEPVVMDFGLARRPPPTPGGLRDPRERPRWAVDDRGRAGGGRADAGHRPAEADQEEPHQVGGEAPGLGVGRPRGGRGGAGGRAAAAEAPRDGRPAEPRPGRGQPRDRVGGDGDKGVRPRAPDQVNVGENGARPQAPDPVIGDPATPAAGFRPLFNGKDLTGWEPLGAQRPDAWPAENGELVAAGADPNKGGQENWMLTARDCSDYLLRVEFQTAAGGLSGIAPRTTPGDKARAVIPVMDDNFFEPLRQKPAPAMFAATLYHGGATAGGDRPPGGPEAGRGVEQDGGLGAVAAAAGGGERQGDRRHRTQRPEPDERPRRPAAAAVRPGSAC
jgi:hypothetical protein